MKIMVYKLFCKFWRSYNVYMVVIGLLNHLLHEFGHGFAFTSHEKFKMKG